MRINTNLTYQDLHYADVHMFILPQEIRLLNQLATNRPQADLPIKGCAVKFLNGPFFIHAEQVFCSLVCSVLGPWINSFPLSISCKALSGMLEWWPRLTCRKSRLWGLKVPGRVQCWRALWGRISFREDQVVYTCSNYAGAQIREGPKRILTSGPQLEVLLCEATWELLKRTSFRFFVMARNF